MTLSIDTIISDPEIRGGRPTIAGRAVTVSDLVARYLSFNTPPEELAVQFDLALWQVYAAIAYYYMNKSEIDEEMRRDEATARQLKTQLAKQGKLLTR